MKYRRLGNTGLRVSEISLGSWVTIGQRLGLRESEALVRAAYDAGVNFFDTAQGYPGAERILGEIFSGFRREEYIIASKVFFAREENEHLPTGGGLSRKSIVQSVHDSLRKLRVDYMDLYYCHRYDPETPLEETVRAFEDLIAQGKILYWGTSQWTAEQITEANRISRYPVAAAQNLYNLFNRKFERTLFDVAAKEGVGIVAYSPLARGVLTHKYASGIPEGSRAADAELKSTIYDLHPEKIARVQALLPLAEKYNCSVAAIVLAFYLTRPGVSSLLIGASRPAQLNDTLAAGALTLDSADVQVMDTLFADYF